MGYRVPISRGFGIGVPHNTPHYLEGKKHAPGGPWILRSFTAVVSVAPKPRDRKPPELVLPDAHIRWGQAGTFETMLLEELEQRGIDIDEPDDDPERERIGYSQEALRWGDFLVHSRYDVESYHITRLPRVLAMAGPNVKMWGGPITWPERAHTTSQDGAQFQFILAYPPHDLGSGKETLIHQVGEGQEPLPPPSLETMGEDD